MGNGSTTVSYTDTVQESCGCNPISKPYKWSNPYVPGNTIYWTVASYDGIGRTISTVKPDGASTTSYQYQGNTVTVTDAAGNAKTYTVDAFGQLIQVQETDPSAGAVYTYYTYDILGHLIGTSMTRTVSGNPITQTRSWNYSSTTQLLSSKTTPESGTTSYTYNSDRTLATVLDANNHEKQFTYDAYQRVTQITRGTVSNGTFTADPTQQTNFTYDSGGACGSNSNTLGHVATISYPATTLSVTESYCYHQAGATTEKSVNVMSAPYYEYGQPYQTTILQTAATYTYDNEGRVSTLAYPGGGPTLTYGYDSVGRPYTVTGGATTVSGATYGPANNMLTLNSSAFTESRSYNNNLQLTNVTGGGYNFTYNYSATQNNGKIQSMSDAISGETVTYQYDSLNRLASASGTGDANGAWSQTFTYDGFGNLAAKAGNNAPNNVEIYANPANNQLTGNNALYDSVGNLLQYGGSFGVTEQVYTYDIENRLKTMGNAGGGTTMHGYDSRNQRILSGSSTALGDLNPCGAANFFFYGVDGKKLAVIGVQLTWSSWDYCAESSTTLSQINIWFAGRLLVPQDRLNSHGKYFPYGEDRTNPNPANPANGVEKFATFTRDAESGLDYAYQRYYASGLGRFLTADPYRANNGGSWDPSDPQSWNRYSHSQGDPVGFNDPQGLLIQAPTGPSGEGDPYCSSGLVDNPYGGCTFAVNDLSPVGGNLGYVGGSGGGGGTGPSQIWLQTFSVLRSAAEFIAGDESLGLGPTGEPDSPCASAVDSIVGSSGNHASIEAVQAAADNVTFVNAEVSMAMLPNTPVPGGQTPVSWYFADNPNTYAVAPLSSRVQYWRPGATIGQSFSWDAAAVMHELLHNLGFTDQQIAQAVGAALVYANGELADTSDITTQLEKLCFF